MEGSNTDVPSLHNKSETLIIIGGGFNGDKLAIQLAKLARHSEHDLKGLGATHVIDRNSASILAQARDMVKSDSLTMSMTASIGPLSLHSTS